LVSGRNGGKERDRAEEEGKRTKLTRHFLQQLLHLLPLLLRERIVEVISSSLPVPSIAPLTSMPIARRAAPLPPPLLLRPSKSRPRRRAGASIRRRRAIPVAVGVLVDTSEGRRTSAASDGRSALDVSLELGSVSSLTGVVALVPSIATVVVLSAFGARIRSSGTMSAVVAESSVLRPLSIVAELLRAGNAADTAFRAGSGRTSEVVLLVLLGDGVSRFVVSLSDDSSG
jgi:hypothetical protein